MTRLLYIAGGIVAVFAGVAALWGLLAVVTHLFGEAGQIALFALWLAFMGAVIGKAVYENRRLKRNGRPDA